MLRWLRDFDPGAAERAELHRVGVSEHTALTLYPADYKAVAPALRVHLHAHGIWLVRSRQDELDARLQHVRELRIDLPPELDSAYRADVSRDSGPEAEELTQEFREQARAAGLDPTVGVFCAAACWYLWWFMHHRDQFAPEQQAKLNATVCWFATHVFQVTNLP